MIGELLGATSALWALGAALLIFGLLPGLFLALIVRLLHRDDPRRRELQAELYAVPRWERPFWVFEQLEVALRNGLFPNVSRWVHAVWWHRAKLESGLECNRRYPESFGIPSGEEKAELCTGDLVKLMWSVKRSPGERMWVRITHRDGDQLVGTLDSWPIFVFMDPGDIVKFHVDDIIDCQYAEDEDGAVEQVA